MRLTSFVGREQQITDLKRLLSLQNVTTEHRLMLTLTGAGGSGKTRLAVRVASVLLDSFKDGAWFVDLAPLFDPTFIPQAVASALSVHEQPGRPLLDTLLDYLHQKELLLIMDNCEQFVGACAELAQTLLQKCPHLQIIATSRERLNIPCETVWLVPVLSLPESENVDWINDMRSEAVQLFVDRAASALPTFALTRQNAAAVAQICRRLDGIPLAIELAAARTKVLSPTQIAARLDDAFRLLTRGSQTAAPRQQTLRATMDWSYELLSVPEQMLFRRLSVFAGGFTLESTEQVCSDDVGSLDKLGTGSTEGEGRNMEDERRAPIRPTSFILHQDEILDLLSDLADKSLVVVAAWEEGDQVRYRMLEPVRQYGGEKLQLSAEKVPSQARHLEFFCKMALNAEPGLRGPRQVEWFQRLDLDYDNLSAALIWSLQAENIDLKRGLQMASALWRYWYGRGYWTQPMNFLETMLKHPETRSWDELRIQALATVGNLAHARGYEGDYAFAERQLDEAIALARGLDLPNPALLAWVLSLQFRVCHYISDPSRIEHCGGLAFESLDYARISEDRWVLAYVCNVIGLYYMYYLKVEDPTRAREYFEQALFTFRSVGDNWAAAGPLIQLGIIALKIGDFTSARKYGEESMAIRREMRDKEGIMTTSFCLGQIARAQGNFLESKAFHTNALSIARDLGGSEWILDSLLGLAAGLRLQGDYAQARTRLNEGLNLALAAKDLEHIRLFLSSFASLALNERQTDRAVRLFSASKHLIDENVLKRYNWTDEITFERDLTNARSALTEQAFATVWLEGHALTLEQAIESALEDVKI